MHRNCSLNLNRFGIYNCQILYFVCIKTTYTVLSYPFPLLSAPPARWLPAARPAVTAVPKRNFSEAKDWSKVEGWEGDIRRKLMPGVWSAWSEIGNNLALWEASMDSD